MSPALLWFVLGLACFLCEMAFPHLVLCFFGLGAWVVAALVWQCALSVAVQTGLFLVLSLALLFALRRGLRRMFRGESRKPGEASPHSHPLCGAQGHITRTGPGECEASIGGSFWRVCPAEAGQQLAEGMSVRVVEAAPGDATLLLVAPLVAQSTIPAPQ